MTQNFPLEIEKRYSRFVHSASWGIYTSSAEGVHGSNLCKKDSFRFWFSKQLGQHISKFQPISAQSSSLVVYKVALISNGPLEKENNSRKIIVWCIGNTGGVRKVASINAEVRINVSRKIFEAKLMRLHSSNFLCKDYESTPSYPDRVTMLNIIWIWIDSNHCRRRITVKRVANNYTPVKHTFFGNHGITLIIARL